MADARECPIRGCTTKHADTLMMCRPHWYSLPKPLRDEVWAAVRSEDGLFGDRYHEARTAAITYCNER